MRDVLRLMGIVASLGATLGPAPAHACDVHTEVELAIEPNAADVEPPSPPSVLVTRVARGEEDKLDGCRPTDKMMSCDDAAFVKLSVEATDDTSDVSALGYVVEPLGGDVPVETSERPIKAENGALYLNWPDDDGRDDAHFRLRVWAVDPAGNVSDQAATVDVRSEGRRSCRLGGGLSGPGNALLVLLALLAGRRRRPSEV